MSLNIENIRKVRDHIAALPPERFSMEDYITERQAPYRRTVGGAIKECGTAACIAGWTVGLLKPRLSMDSQSIDLTAMSLLGLREGQEDTLFRPDGYAWDTFTIPQAVRTLDHLMATGEVKWDRTVP